MLPVKHSDTVDLSLLVVEEHLEYKFTLRHTRIKIEN
jgi:hypothetical protein